MIPNATVFSVPKSSADIAVGRLGSHRVTADSLVSENYCMCLEERLRSFAPGPAGASGHLGAWRGTSPEWYP